MVDVSYNMVEITYNVVEFSSSGENIYSGVGGHSDGYSGERYR